MTVAATIAEIVAPVAASSGYRGGKAARGAGHLVIICTG
jgi:hypothetical protein